jgi:P4 family phage/plasmid primase-like protien
MTKQQQDFNIRKYLSDMGVNWFYSYLIDGKIHPKHGYTDFQTRPLNDDEKTEFEESYGPTAQYPAPYTQIMLGPTYMFGRPTGANILCFDLDNKPAIREFLDAVKRLIKFTNELTLEILANIPGFLIEISEDNTRAHIYMTTQGEQIRSRALVPEKGKEDENVPMIEIFSTSKHLVTIGKDTYRFLGEPRRFFDNLNSYPVADLEKLVDFIEHKYENEYSKISYNIDDYNFVNSNADKDDEFYLDLKEKIQGYRNNTLRPIFTKYVQDHWGKPIDELIDWALRYNNRNCQVPLPKNEIVTLIHSRIKYVGSVIELKKRQEVNSPKLEPESKTKESTTNPTLMLEQELTNKYHFKSMKDNGEIWYYDGKIYRKNADWLIQQECIKYDPESKTTDVNDILNRIRWSNYTDREVFDTDIKWIAFDNVMVNLLTGETAKHSPDFMVTVKIPHTYVDLHKTPHIPAPQNILKFLHDVIVNPDNVETVLDFMAYCLWRAFPFHRWLLLNGSGRNGKGVTTELITRALGQDNVSSEELQRILTNNFASARLYGKMANIDADLSSEELKQTGRLNKLTGNDRLPGEYKFKTAFDFKNYAKMIFSANQMPITPDETDAFFIRILIINFPKQFLGVNDNPHLIDELTTPEEMSLLLSLLIRRLPRVLKTGIYYKDSIEDTRVKYMESADPIRIFIESAIRREVGSWTTKDGVYDEYENFCLDRNLPKESQETFSRRLKAEGYQYKRKRVDGQKIYVWTDVKYEDYRQIERKQLTLVEDERADENE